MNSSGNYILVRSPDGVERRVPIKARHELTIGRKAGNDLVLDDPYVGRYHARVQFDGIQYWVRDLGSINRTELNDRPLTPDKPHEWAPGDELRIGNHLLYIVHELSDKPPPLPPPMPGRIDLSIGETELSVEPGGSTSTSITICNLGPVYDTFDIDVRGEGIQDEWVRPEPADAIRLEPDEEGAVTLSISPPPEPESRAGRYPLKIRARSRDKPDEVAEVPAVLTITPYHQSHPELKTRRIVGKRGTVWVKIENNGNAQQTYSIGLEDPAGDLVFEPAETELTVPAGEEAEAEFTVMLRRRRWVGDEKLHGFSVEISAPEENILPHPGSIRSTGYLSARALRLLGITLAIGLVLFLFVWPSMKPSIKCHIDSPNPPVAGQPFTVICDIKNAQSLKLESFNRELDPEAGLYSIEALDTPTKLVFVASNRFGSTTSEVPVPLVTPTPTLMPTATPVTPTSTLIPTATPTPTITPEPTPESRAGGLTLNTWSYSTPGYAFTSLWLSGPRADESDIVSLMRDYVGGM
jgi:cell division septation protein DedD